MGHRQDLTVLRITDILAKGKKTKVTRAKAKTEDGSPVVEATETVAEEMATATDAPAAEEVSKPAARKRPRRTKKAKAVASTEEAATKPKRVATPNAADNAVGTAGEPEEKS